MGKRGPQPKGEYAGQSAVLSTRISPSLRARLEVAVEQSGKTISREVEHRLRRTFIEDDKIEAAFGSRENYWLMRFIALAMQDTRVPFHKASDWRNDPLLFDNVLKTVNNVLEAIRPAAASPDRAEELKAMTEFAAERIPAALWEWLQEAGPALPLHEGTHKQHLAGLLKSELGEIVDRPQPKTLAEMALKKMQERAVALGYPEVPEDKSGRNVVNGPQEKAPK